MMRRRRTVDLLCYVFLVAAALVTLLPFVWMVSSSLMPRHEIFAPGFRLFPSSPTLVNYGEALREAPLLRFLTNGVIVTVSILVGQLFTILPAGYAFARLRFRGQVVLFALVLAALGVPGYVRAIPNFLLLSRLDLLNTYAALIVPFIGSAFGIFLMRQFFRQLPSDVIDAARLDGCGTGQLIWHILVPLTRPAVAAFAVFSVVAHWNDFFWPLVVIRTSNLLTPPAGIAFFANAEGGENWGVVMAAGVVVIAPLVVVFLIARRHFIASLAQGAVKG
jgi:multiple sugar transport system permease protein